MALTGRAHRSISNVPGASVNNTVIDTIWGGHPVAATTATIQRGATGALNSTEWHWIGSAIDDKKPLADWATNSVVSHASMNGTTNRNSSLDALLNF